MNLLYLKKTILTSAYLGSSCGSEAMIVKVIKDYAWFDIANEMVKNYVQMFDYKRFQMAVIY